MIITGSDSTAIAEVKSHLFREFEMKNLGPLRYFLGIEVASSPQEYLLGQSKLFDTPLELHAKFSASDDVSLEDPTEYRELVGCLVYLTITRPDISYAVHIVSQFVSAHRTTHWAALLRILRYLCGTLQISSTSSLTLHAYADANWAGDVNDRKSTYGLCVFLGDSLISWKSKKKYVVARPTAEAKYRAMAHATSEIAWLRWLISDMGVSVTTPTPLYCDNKSAI
ncbi:secreted RxLR effector protein 161-like [Rhododendron vialii]|uniref:secreted RxLR effector protein 161-like n=1 Tax=Rhododendron vialii TaxID=182163 RepID=UPI00265D6859|nr:secreted RxLR effector protein 161-like [Rhododendron vialii]